MTTILITGGAGFIGSNLVRYALRTTDYNIVIVDKLTYASNQLALAAIADHPRVTFVRADIADRAEMSRVFLSHRPSAVLNLAAETHVDRSIDSSWAFVETNITGTVVLLESARELMRTLPSDARDVFRFLHVSTDEVYGSLGPTGYFTETTPYSPNSPYAASKASADHLVRAYFSTYGLPTLTTNCSNNYGPFQHSEKLIPLMILNAIDARPLPVYGDGYNVRDWLHVEDHCAAIMLALEKGRVGESYNIGASNEQSNIAIVDRICAVLESVMPARGNPAMVRAGLDGYEHLKHFVADRPGHDRRYAVDAGKIRRELGWKPAHSFDEGLRATIDWYIEHREWFSRDRHGYGRERLGLGAVAQ